MFASAFLRVIVQTLKHFYCIIFSHLEHCETSKKVENEDPTESVAASDVLVLSKWPRTTIKYVKENWTMNFAAEGGNFVSVFPFSYADFDNKLKGKNIGSVALL